MLLHDTVLQEPLICLLQLHHGIVLIERPIRILRPRGPVLLELLRCHVLLYAQTDCGTYMPSLVTSTLRLFVHDTDAGCALRGLQIRLLDFALLRL